MSYQRIIGIEVSDPQEYANYSAAMKPILIPILVEEHSCYA